MKQVLSLVGGTTLYQIGIRLLFQFICYKADVPTIADNVKIALSACSPPKERTMQRHKPKHTTACLRQVVSKCALRDIKSNRPRVFVPVGIIQNQILLRKKSSNRSGSTDLTSGKTFSSIAPS